MILIVGVGDLRLPPNQNVPLSGLRPNDFASSRSDGEVVARANYIFYVDDVNFAIVKAPAPMVVGQVNNTSALPAFLRAALKERK